MLTLPELLQKVVRAQGSDLHLATKTRRPRSVVHGHLQRIDAPDLTASETKQLAYSALTDAQKKR
jgi:twitching motility protein PilT